MTDVGGWREKKKERPDLICMEVNGKHLLTEVGTGEIHSEWKFIPVRLRRGGELALTEELIHKKKLKAEGSNWGPRRHSQESFHIWDCWEAKEPLAHHRSESLRPKLKSSPNFSHQGTWIFTSLFWILARFLSVRSCHLWFAVIGCRNSWDGLPCQLLLTALNGLRELWAIVYSTGTGVCGAGSSGFLNW